MCGSCCGTVLAITCLSKFVLSTRPLDLGFSEEKQCVLAVSLVVPLQHVKTLRALAKCTLRAQAVEQRVGRMATITTSRARTRWRITSPSITRRMADTIRYSTLAHR